MALKIQVYPIVLWISSNTKSSSSPFSLPYNFGLSSSSVRCSSVERLRLLDLHRRVVGRRRIGGGGISAALRPLDLTEDNVRQVLADARTEFAQIFDTTVGITGEAELTEVDGPFVKISLKGRFWHERSMVLARLGNYLKQRIPEILEVDIEDEKQLDDSPENF